MHEMAATENILSIALKAGEENKVSRINKINIELGMYSGLLPEFVIKYFAIASEGTKAEGAELVFMDEPVHIKCNSCGADSEIFKESEPVCPLCGSSDFRMIQGWDVRVKSIEAD